MDAKSLSVEDFYKFPVKLLESIGCFLLPKIPKNRLERVRIALMRCFFWFSMFAYCCAIVSYAACVALNLDDQKIIARVLPALIHIPGLDFRLLVLYKNRYKVREIFGTFSKLLPKTRQEQKENDVHSFYRSLVIYEKVLIVLAAFLFVGIYFKAISEFMKSEREMVIEMWIPFNTSTDHGYVIATVYMIFIAMITACISFSTSLIICSMMTLTALTFHTLANDLKKALSEKNIKMAGLKNLIDRQNELADLINQMQSLHSAVFLMMFVEGSMVICVSGYVAMAADDMADSVNYSQFLITILNDIFFICFFCQKITDASESLVEGITDSNWYEVDDKKVKKTIPLMIQRAQKTAFMTGEGFVVISREAFSSVSRYMRNHCFKLTFT
jgi:ABC-type multidrug transport system fused ATPase/permease subunit